MGPISIYMMNGTDWQYPALLKAAIQDAKIDIAEMQAKTEKLR